MTYILQLLSAVALWCGSAKDIQACRDRIIKCMAEESANLNSRPEISAGNCFIKERIK